MCRDTLLIYDITFLPKSQPPLGVFSYFDKTLTAFLCIKSISFNNPCKNITIFTNRWIMSEEERVKNEEVRSGAESFGAEQNYTETNL